MDNHPSRGLTLHLRGGGPNTRSKKYGSVPRTRRSSP